MPKPIYYGKSKYHNTKVTVNGIKFDSKKEAERYLQLVDMQMNGLICNLQLQTEWTLIPSQKTPSGETLRPVKYRSDFTYYKKGKLVVEDVKGVRTPEYIIKRKMMFEKFGVEIIEI